MKKIFPLWMIWIYTGSLSAVCGDLNVSYLYLKPHVDHVFFGHDLVSPQGSSELQLGYEPKNVEYDYASGFALQLCFEVGGWQCFASWSHLQQDYDKKLQGIGQASLASETSNNIVTQGTLVIPSGVSFPFFGDISENDPTLITSDLQGRFKFHWNVLDLGLRHDIGSCVRLSPLFGIRSVFLEHQISSYYTLVSTLDSQESRIGLESICTNDWKSLGAFGGLEACYPLCRGVSIVGQTTGALLFGQRDVTAKFQAFAVPDDSFPAITRVSYCVESVVPELTTFLGMEWCEQMNRTYSIFVRVGWEQRMYWNCFETPRPLYGNHIGDGGAFEFNDYYTGRDLTSQTQQASLHGFKCSLGIVF